MHACTNIYLKITYRLQSVRLVRHRGIYSLAISIESMTEKWDREGQDTKHAGFGILDPGKKASR